MEFPVGFAAMTLFKDFELAQKLDNVAGALSMTDRLGEFPHNRTRTDCRYKRDEKSEGVNEVVKVASVGTNMCCMNWCPRTEL